MKKVLLSFGIIVYLMIMTEVKTAASENRFDQKRAFHQKELIGRWDLTLDVNGKPAPSWMEVKLSGDRTLVGYFVGVVGSARPIAKVFFDNGKFWFNIPPQWESGDKDFYIEGMLNDNSVTGNITMSDGKKYAYTGVRAPLMKRNVPIVWQKPITLFNGKDLAGWKAMGANQWIVKNGVLTSPHSGSNLVSEQKFTDFKLHVEFRYPKGSNSGIYLRGRHEVQVEDSPKEAHPSSVLFGGVYGFLTPCEIATKGPGQWQTYDITLIGRMITIIANGKTIISNQEIPGPTGGALDSNEDEPGPIYFQGDHGPIEFKNIIITPAK